MKIAFFSTKSYDIEYFEKFNTNFQHELHFFETRLNEKTVNLIDNQAVVCVFVNDNLTSPDLHVQIGSAAIDNGDPAYIPDATEVDMDGNIRIFNTIIDCGANEYGSSSGGGCPNDYAGMNQLTGIQSVMADFETNGVIDSDQIISSNAIVDYDSETEINLLMGFETELGVIFSAFIDGCGGMFVDGEIIDKSKN